MTNLLLVAIGVGFFVTGWFAPAEPVWANRLAFVGCCIAGVYCITAGLA